MRDAEPSEGRAAWQAIGQVIAAHVVMLRDVAILDDPVAAALLSALDGVGRGDPPSGGSMALVAAFDERLEALSPAGVVGAGAVGRGRAEVVAATMRLLLRGDLLRLAAAVDEVRIALLDLAGEHVFTLMPAYADGQPAQPTTLAHFLGGVIAPLARSAARLRSAYAEVNRSPLGAVALASTGLPIDRERVADLLGFDGPVASTYDAVAAVDHVAAAVEVAGDVAVDLRRFLAELLTWLRTEPGSLRLGEDWLAPVDPGLPQHRPPAGLERLVVDARRAEGEAATAVRLLAEAPYGPAGATLDAAVAAIRAALAGAVAVAAGTAELVRSGLEVNRAYLANRAGRDHTTTSELATFLMTEEGLDPAAARNIALMTVRKAIGQGIEASGITPAMIDASALLVIGRELAVELEALGRALAPRRVIERRTAPGAPAAAATRDYLELERTRLLADERWRDERDRHLAAARTRLDRAIAEIATNAG